jgi:ATP-dependent RNA helicase DeaD
MLRDLADRVVVLHRPHQVGSLGRMSDPVREISVSPEADRAHRTAIELRTDLRSQLGRADLTGEMLQLAPLFDEYDPAAVAAALVRRSGGGVAPTGTSYPSWVRIRLDLGKRDRIKAGDIVGALINAAHTPKDHVGHIDLRETFTVVEVRTESAEAAFRALGEITLRGRPAKPQIDTK